jgi:hypothetical protein
LAPAGYPDVRGNGRKFAAGFRMRQIKWQEPASFIRALKRRTNRGISRKRQAILFIAVAGGLALVFGAAFVVGYARHGFKEGFPLPLWAPPAIVFGAAFAIAYVIPWVSSLTNAQIAVSGTGVYRTSRESAVLVFQQWPWQEIKRCTVEPVSFDEARFQALRLLLRDGQTVSIGLSDKLDVGQLRGLLRSLGKLEES